MRQVSKLVTTKLGWLGLLCLLQVSKQALSLRLTYFRTPFSMALAAGLRGWIKRTARTNQPARQYG